MPKPKKQQDYKSKWSYENASKRFEEKFPSDDDEKVKKTSFNMEQKVRERLTHPIPAYEYPDDNNEIKEVRRIMMEMSNTADMLYMKAKRDGVDYDTSMPLPEPTVWLYNQEKMRKMWEGFKSKLEGMPPLVGSMMINNSFGDYMKFMYDNYPEGFGKKIMEAYNKGVKFDGARVFKELKNW